MADFGLIGKTLSYSFSQSYFQKKFKALGLDHNYHNFELEDIGQFKTLLEENPKLKGLNVTIPYKTAIIPFLDKLSPDAGKIGAVNTIQFLTGKTIGHNTDWIGFRNSIKPFLAHGMEKALILGTGGASKSVQYALEQIGIEVFFASTSPSGPKQFSYDQLNEQAMKMFKLIMNTTPLGMSPNIETFPDIPYAAIGPDHLLFDLNYNPTETLFLKKGKANGALTVNGLSMLQIQAEKSWAIWNG